MKTLAGELQEDFRPKMLSIGKFPVIFREELSNMRQEVSGVCVFFLFIFILCVGFMFLCVFAFFFPPHVLSYDVSLECMYVPGALPSHGRV